MAPGRCSDADGTCGTLIAVPYFVSFTIVGAMVMLNLVVAVVVDTYADDAADFKLSAEQVEAFVEVWAKYDEKGTNFMPSKQLKKLLSEKPLWAALGWDKGGASPESSEAVTRKITELNIPDYDG